MTSVELFNRNFSIRLNDVSANMSRAVAVSGINIEKSLRATQASLIKNITANLNKVEVLDEHQKRLDEVCQDTISNLVLSCSP